MSELSETYELIKKVSREKKLSNKEFSTVLLDKMGIDYESKNNGIHLIVFNDLETIDFYPSTGRWLVRGGKTSRGVMKMLDYMQVGTKCN